MLIWVLLSVVACAVAAPTQDTQVVSRAEETTTASSTPSSIVAVATPEVQKEGTSPSPPNKEEETTQGADLPLKVSSMEVTANVSLRYARTAVVTNVRNPGSRAKEHVFAILLPDTAFISGFVMTLNGKSYKAYVKEKEQAKNEYNQAVSQGIAAAHVAAKARDSNHFTVSVNVEPHTEAIFNLTYEELLERQHGLYELAVNLHPGTVVPKLDVKIHLKEPSKITSLYAPAIRTGNEIDHVTGEDSNPSATIVKSENEQEATITFSPDLIQQKELMAVYAQKSRDSRLRGRSRNYYKSESEEGDNTGVLGQFVVQYDVERPAGGEVMVNDGYFVHFFAPKSLPPINKHVVFVLDTSGSMMDRKIVQLREAMTSILQELHKGDFFSLVEFSSGVIVHDLSKDAPEEKPNQYHYYPVSHEPTKLYPPARVNDVNIDKAKKIVNTLDAAGGTNIADALSTAIDLVHKGVDWSPEEHIEVSTVTTPKSDNPTATSTEGIPELPTAVAVKSKDVEESDTLRLEPIIIFLTDGDPTVGETSPKKIINRIAEKNYGSNKAAIFSLAFGEDADRSFLRKISLSNEGFMRHIYEAADSALQLRKFYEQVSSPLLSHVRFNYPKEQIEEGSLTKHQFRTFYKGSEVVVAGRVPKELETFEPVVEAFCGVTDEYEGRKFKGKPRVEMRREATFLPLERLWAYLTIKQRLDEKDAAEASDQKPAVQEALEKQALDLALKYSFVTPLTSLVVVKPNSSAAVDAESVDKQTPDTAAYASAGMPGAYSYQISALALPEAALLSAPAVLADPVALSEDEADDMRCCDDVNDMPDFDRIVGGSAAAVNSPADFVSKIDTLLTTTSSTTLQTSDETPTTVPGNEGLKAFGLEKYAFFEPYLNQSESVLEVPINGSNVTFKLTKLPNETQNESGVECENAVSGGAGTCTYLQSCVAASSISTLDQYIAHHCSKDGYLGVCCPKVPPRLI